MIISKETSPHLHKKTSVSRMMLDVIIALLPAVVFSIVAFRIKAVIILLISIFTMLISEFAFVGIVNAMPYDGKKHSFKEKFKFAYSKFSLSNVLAPLVSAIIYAMILPASLSWYAVLVGALFGIIVGKLLFGGLGNNIFNPAAVGMVVVKISFGKQCVTTSNAFYDVTTGGTALTGLSNSYANLNNYSLLDLFFGRTSGTLGEISAICILIGGIYLFIRSAANYRACLSYLVTFTLLMMVAGLFITTKYDLNFFKFIGVELLSGGLLFGSVFMLTDPVTSPITSPGKIMFGMIAAICTVFIRLFAALPEGVVFSILIANMFTPVLDYSKWSSQKFTLKKLIVIGCLLLVPALIITIVFLVGGGY